MNEIEVKQFDYNSVDKPTAEFLQKKESNMREIVGKAYTELGRELYEAQQTLASHNKYEGVFERWYTSIGFKKRSVYNYINRYNLVQQLHNIEQKERVEELPNNLLYELGSSSAESTPAKVEAKQAVLKGEVKTLKEYKELVERLEEVERVKRELEKNNNKLKQDNEKLGQLLTEERNKPQESVTVEVEKVVDNTDYETIERLKMELDELNEKKNDYQLKYDQTLNRLAEAQDKVNMFMGENTNFNLVKNTSENTRKMREFLKEMSEYDYLSDVFNEIPDATRREYVRSINGVYKWANNLLSQIKSNDVVELNDNIINLLNYKEEN